MSMYHSQDRQDQFLHTMIFKDFTEGLYVDVGAHDGVKFNNTLFFHKKKNWFGVNIEPIPKVFEKLVKNRPNDLNLNIAIDKTGGFKEFILNTGYTEMLSGLKEHYDPRHKDRLKNELKNKGGTSETIKVETMPLSKVFSDNNITEIMYLSVDVEGGEKSVIESIDFSKVFIDVIGFENNYNDNSNPIVQYLQKLGYIQLPYNGLDIMMIHENSYFNN